MAQEFHIAHGEYAAVIAARGAGIKALTYRGEPLVETYAAEPPRLAGLVLAPWPNRTADGRFTWNGRTYRLPITEPERHNAIHGLVYDRDWECQVAQPSCVRLTITIQEPWPWEVELSAEFSLDEAGLHARYTAATQAEETVPFALGVHTYLSARGAATDDAVLTIPVTQRHLLDARNLPTGVVEPARIQRQPMAGVVWDDCFHGEGPLYAEYVDRGTGQGVRMDLGEGLRWVQLYTPDDYPGRGRALAVEPQSAPPNALVDGRDVALLTATTPQTFELTLSALGDQKN